MASDTPDGQGSTLWQWQPAPAPTCIAGSLGLCLDFCTSALCPGLSFSRMYRSHMAFFPDGCGLLGADHRLGILPRLTWPIACEWRIPCST